MEKTVFSLHDEDVFLKNRHEKIKQLKSNDTIIKLANKLNFDVETISNLSLLEEYLMIEKVCDSCQCLSSCPFDVKGQRLNLDYNGILFPIKEYCAKYKQNINNQAYLKNYVYNDVPNSMMDIELSKIDVDKDNKDYLKLWVILNEIVNHNFDRGLYIFGKFGTGKTYLSIAFLNTLAKLGHKVAFVKVNDFVNRMRKMIVNDSQMCDEIIEELKRVDYLVFDDIGSESITPFVRDDVLFNILDYRMENALITIFTSNHSIDTLCESFIYDNKQNRDVLKAERLMERIKVLAIPYHLSGNNRRKY